MRIAVSLPTHAPDRSPDVHSPQTISNLSSLLAAPINSYQSVLTLLAIPRYSSLLSQQPYSTRRSLSHAVISSILKNETIIETPEDVDGVLELCHVLIKDQSDSGLHSGAVGQQQGNKDSRRQGPYPDREDTAEEQGWVARMVHLFRADSVDTQFEVITTAFIHPQFSLFPSFYTRRGSILI
jgi:vacuolar protein sorting-associated protein 35